MHTEIWRNRRKMCIFWSK